MSGMMAFSCKLLKFPLSDRFNHKTNMKSSDGVSFQDHPTSGVVTSVAEVRGIAFCIVYGIHRSESAGPRTGRSGRAGSTAPAGT